MPNLALCVGSAGGSEQWKEGSVLAELTFCWGVSFYPLLFLYSLIAGGGKQLEGSRVAL